MAIAVSEIRTFENTRTGEIIKYEFRGIVGTKNGKQLELPLKNLNPAEKLAFDAVAEADNPVQDGEVASRTSSNEEKEKYQKGIKKSGSDDGKLDLESEDYPESSEGKGKSWLG